MEAHPHGDGVRVYTKGVDGMATATASTRTRRPVKRTYQRKRLPSTICRPRCRGRVLPVSLPIPVPVPVPLPLPIPDPSLGLVSPESSSKSDESENSSLHVKHTSCEIFDALLKSRPPPPPNGNGNPANTKRNLLKVSLSFNVDGSGKSTDEGDDANEKSSNDAETISFDGSENFIDSDTAGDDIEIENFDVKLKNFCTHQRDEIYSYQKLNMLNDYKNFSNANIASSDFSEEFSRKDIKSEVESPASHMSLIFTDRKKKYFNRKKNETSIQHHSENIDKCKIGELESSQKFKNLNNLDEELKDPKMFLISSTPCKKITERYADIHISPITITPCKTENDEFTLNYCKNGDGLTVPCPNGEYDSRESPILFSSSDDIFRDFAFNEDLYRQISTSLRFFSADSNLKQSPIEKLKNLINDAEVNLEKQFVVNAFKEEKVEKRYDSENSKTLASYKFLMEKQESLIGDARSISERNGNHSSSVTYNSAFENSSIDGFEKTFKKLSAEKSLSYDMENTEFITKRRSSKTHFLSPDVPIRSRFINSTFGNLSTICEMTPNGRLSYHPGKKLRRSINLIRQIKLLNQTGTISNGKGDLSNQTKNDGDTLRSYIKNRRCTIMFEKASGYDEIITDNKSVLFEIGEETDSELHPLTCDGLSTKLIDLSKLAISEVARRPRERLDETDESRRRTAEDEVFRNCDQSGPLAFRECYPDAKLNNCRKIGEGVYGEVFLFKNPDDPLNPSVIKIIPIEGDLIVNGDRQKKYEEIASEIIISKELSSLRYNDLNNTSNFVKVLQVKCVRGVYPERLLDLWDLYDELHESENDCPSVFTSEQLYIVLELANCGKDLEAFRFETAEQAYSVFIQVAFALAVAEEAYQFEHRDLHWGNILVLNSDEKVLVYKLRGNSYTIPTNGVFASIIDYTLSRISLPNSNINIYNDLAKDDDLFDGEGDYQFDVYRHMKDKNRNVWHTFEPFTNILWLDYMLEKLIHQCRYDKPNLKIHHYYITKLLEIKDDILHYDSCIDFALNEQI